MKMCNIAFSTCKIAEMAPKPPLKEGVSKWGEMGCFVLCFGSQRVDT